MAGRSAIEDSKAGGGATITFASVQLLVQAMKTHCKLEDGACIIDMNSGSGLLCLQLAMLLQEYNVRIWGVDQEECRVQRSRDLRGKFVRACRSHPHTELRQAVDDWVLVNSPRFSHRCIDAYWGQMSEEAGLLPKPHVQVMLFVWEDWSGLDRAKLARSAQVRCSDFIIIVQKKVMSPSKLIQEHGFPNMQLVHQHAVILKATRTGESIRQWHL